MVSSSSQVSETLHGLTLMRDQLNIQKAAIHAQILLINKLVKTEIDKLEMMQPKPAEKVVGLNHSWHLYVDKLTQHKANTVLCKILVPAITKCKCNSEPVTYSIVRDGSKEWWAIRLNFHSGQRTFLMKVLKEALVGLNE